MNETKHDINNLIIGLYTKLPPRRLIDYAYMKYEKYVEFKQIYEDNEKKIIDLDVAQQKLNS